MFRSFTRFWSPAFSLVMLYIVVGAVWVLVTDMIAERMALEPHVLQWVQTLKGWFFVVVSAMVFYLVTSRYFEGLHQARQLLEESSGDPHTLPRSSQETRKLMSHIPGMVYRCSNDRDWSMLYIEGNSRELTGYTREELLHNKKIAFNEVIHPDDRQLLWEQVQQMIHTRQPYIVRYRIITPDGTLKWVRERATGVFDDRGELLYLEGFITDISDQVNYEMTLKHQGDLMRNIIDNIPFPLFYKDVDGKYMGCNHFFCQYVGKDYEEIIGHTAFDLFPARQAQFFHEKDKALLERGEEFKYETRIGFADGRTMDALFHKSVFHDAGGQPAGIIGVYFDITDRKQAEDTIRRQLGELERINKELERFTYTVSHDLRSPLVTIKGFLGMLREDALEGDHEQMEMDIQRIANAADKMHFLLEDLLQLSRIGRVGNPFSRFSMNEVVDELLEYIGGIIKENKCRIIVQPDMPEVFGDRNRVMEVLQNLVENAIKFRSPDRELIVEIGCRTNEPVPVFYVKDNGEGIDAPYHKKIFGLFSKLDPRSPGTGIGLALVQRIVEFHGGSVWVESEGEGHGACFCFTLSGE